MVKQQFISSNISPNCHKNEKYKNRRRNNRCFQGNRSRQKLKDSASKLRNMITNARKKVNEEAMD